MKNKENQLKLWAEIESVFIKNKTILQDALDVLANGFLNYMYQAEPTEQDANDHIDDLKAAFLEIKRGHDERKIK